MTDCKTVWIVTSPRTRKVYHSKENCSHLHDSQRPVSLENLTDRWRECSYCKGTAGTGGGANDVYRMALEL
jgi:hypothetical protein